jgi:hypothetical protein
MRAPPTYACAYCGRRWPADQMIYSSHTGNRFCATEQKRCEKQGAKLRRERSTTRA